MKKFLKIFNCLFFVVVCNIITYSQVSGKGKEAMDYDAKIYVAGHNGLVGSAIVEKLTEKGFKNIITRSHKELDLRDQLAVNKFFENEKPELVFLAAAHVGGIYANYAYPADFITNNIQINTNVINASHRYQVTKLLVLGSSCIYPRECMQPIKEEYLLSGPLEPTNEMYAIAKIASLKMCQAYNKQYGTKFISCMPTNLYGINDNFDLNSSHVIPGLIAKFCIAQAEGKDEVVCWGTGAVSREFLNVKDLAEAVIFLMQNYEEYGENSWINIGTGEDIVIRDLIMMIRELTGFEGKVTFDTSKPDGTPRKLLNVDRINNLGWKASVNLREGLKEVIEWYKKNKLVH